MDCPYCEKNGKIKKAKVKGSGTVIYLCDECDELWTDPCAIRKNNSVDFGEFMESRGGKGVWPALEEINENWELDDGLLSSE